jgi:hypothetical protein
MLKKLLKYEIKSSARILLPLYISLILFAVISNIFLKINDKKLFVNAISIISIMAYIFIIIAIFVLTLVVMIQRFYKNLLGNEGYLMFTLPVRTGNHIFSKLISSMMWIIAGVVVTISSIIIISFNGNTLGILKNGIIQLFSQINRVFGSNGYIYLAEFIITIFLILATNILMVYASIAMGHLVSKHRVLGAFGAYLGFYILSQFIISMILLLFHSLSLNERYSLGAIFSFIEPVYSNIILHYMFVFVMILNILFAGAYYCITSLILTKRLNLE